MRERKRERKRAERAGEIEQEQIEAHIAIAFFTLLIFTEFSSTVAIRAHHSQCIIYIFWLLCKWYFVWGNSDDFTTRIPMCVKELKFRMWDTIILSNGEMERWRWERTKKWGYPSNGWDGNVEMVLYILLSTYSTTIFHLFLFMHERRTHSFSNMFYIIDTVCVCVCRAYTVSRESEKKNRTYKKNLWRWRTALCLKIRWNCSVMLARGRK